MKKHYVIFSVLIATAFFLINGCKKDSNDTSSSSGGSSTATITDIDGNVYHSIHIGSQEWMIENLRVKHFNDGSAIPNINDSTGWATDTNGAYCFFDNDLSKQAIYGNLYNWYAVHTGMLAPAGWHVASDSEFTVLTDLLGGESVAGGKMKNNSSYWGQPNVGATNSSGFNALPGGFRNWRCEYFNESAGPNWWTSSQSSSDVFAGIERWLTYNDVYIRRVTSTNKHRGYYVRCIKN